jgi:hypothetical protein
MSDVAQVTRNILGLGSARSSLPHWDHFSELALVGQMDCNRTQSGENFTYECRRGKTTSPNGSKTERRG